LKPHLIANSFISSNLFFLKFLKYTNSSLFVQDILIYAGDNSFERFINFSLLKLNSFGLNFQIIQKFFLVSGDHQSSHCISDKSIAKDKNLSLISAIGVLFTFIFTSDIFVK